VFLIILVLLGHGLLPAQSITLTTGQAVLKAGFSERVIRIIGNTVRTVRYSVGGQEMLAAPAREFSVAISREQSNRRPRGLRPGETPESNYFSAANRARWRSENFDHSRYDDTRADAPKWVDRVLVEASAWQALASPPRAEVSKAGEATRLTIHTALSGNPVVEGVRVELNYEAYGSYPVVRKWVRIGNGGRNWLKLDAMVIDDLHLAPLTRKPLAAAMFGVQPSVVAFEAPGGVAGLIAASEIPSALRFISDQGAMGYNPNLFEWVLGPGEEFISEPVFYFGFNGEVHRTISSVSTPLDRTIEGQYMDFLRRRIGVAADHAPMHGPQWMTWAYFYDKIDDVLVRQLADIASRAGFSEMLFDDGWQKGRLGTEIDTVKFPDFAATADFVKSKGMALGLWVSCFRNRDSRDMREMPDARILPELIRSPALPGLAMSFASPWRDYYVNDLIELARRYGIRYFKQDFTNIMYGDLAEGHESRTRKESLLRGLRGLLDAQAKLRQKGPAIVNEITHEIYWGTPGVPADLAALKVTARFHIPPNEAIGTDLAREFQGRTISSGEHAEALRRGCWLARQRFYSHRGLPLYPLEFYAAATTNHEGSLTPQIQDRQVASWLMGMPVCYSGDARTLSAANIAHYRKRLDEIRRLQKAYGIYQYFQFSGVPEPTDTDWHWWGKLNAEGYGVVVVVRGSEGAPRRAVNIPWVRHDRDYRLAGQFSGKQYGTAQGASLQEAGITVELPVFGQELLELAPK
jgi:hypothetical protein